MTDNKFTLEVGDEKFVLIKLFENETDFSLYVLPYNEKLRGFFMIKNPHNRWEIFHKILVSNEILKLESTLADMIAERLR